MDIAVCLINYNSYQDTVECVESLLGQVDSPDFKIVIVDNCSTNESIVEIGKFLNSREIFYLTAQSDIDTKIEKEAKVFLIQSLTNGGFSAGNNVAIRFIQKYLQANYILLLNNDTVVPADFLRNMLHAYQDEQQRGSIKIALGAREINFFTQRRTHSGFQYVNLCSGLTANMPLFPYFKYICGACIMLDGDAPLLDERYFLYFDDAEYACILRKRGYRLTTTDMAYYWHKVSTTTSTFTSITDTYFQSMWRFYRRHYHIFIPLVLVVRYLWHVVIGVQSKNKILLKTFKLR